MIVQEFLSRVEDRYKSGSATEHTYRSALEFLFENIESDISAINEPKRVKCGAPDFIIERKGVTIGHAEAKDLDVDLRHMKDANAEQKERYLRALPNLIYTNCLDFDFYRDGELVASISIGDFLMGIQPKPENFEALEHQLRDFLAQRPQTITSAKKLAQMMAGKALLIKDVLGRTLREDEDLQTELSTQYRIFKEDLIHDITPEDFADIYAETVAYGMFAARLHDDTTADFSRQEALERLPKTYPFLRNLFAYIAGPNLDDRIRWIIDELADVFQACDLHELMADFGMLTGRNDPFLHFYETFLAAYNPKKRKARGVWYTPEPVVNFIVRAVDQVLQTEFGLPLGLADTSKITVDWETGQTDRKGRPLTIKKEVHRVQILDPATGTGTFLAEVIKQIAPKVKGMAEGMWSAYVEKDLIPRLHGFELLMASYAMCHMKLDMVLTDLGYKPSANPPRMSVYLTNSLEEGEPANQTLPFAQWLSNEVKQANAIKRDMPIMCVIGNPPYSGISQNMGDWIVNLIEDYKYVDGEHFGERKHWLHDDYVKFIRLAEHLIARNGEGVLGFITNHGYLDNPTFRGMRWHLMQTFDKIYVFDLHGNANKGEVSPDGTADQNVFDIQQGVALFIGIKKNKVVPGPADVFHGEIWGARENKYQALFTDEYTAAAATEVKAAEPQYAFVPRNLHKADEYLEGFGLGELMAENVSGIVTMGDDFAISQTSSAMMKKLEDLLRHEYTAQTFKARYSLGKNYSQWIIGNKPTLAKAQITPVHIAYRPFDIRWTCFDSRILWRRRERIMRHYMGHPNIGLLVTKALRDASFAHSFVTTTISEAIFLSGVTASNAMNLPLYLYPSEQDLDQTRRVNFDPAIYAKIREAASDDGRGEPDELAVFDYIYGVLYCPAYRETYKEFLKIDFPRIPYPPSPEVFRDVSEKGGQLRRLHLMEPEAVGEAPYPFRGEGDNVVDKPVRDDAGRVRINKTQYFENVPEIAWNFWIGGYQPAQKWLKDRKGRALSFDDVLHYQRIIKILGETDRIMKTIEMPLGDETPPVTL